MTKTTKKKPVKRTKKPAKPQPRAVMVTTQHRGVFFGYATDTSGAVIKLEKARNCLFWHASVKGVFGLATEGPNRQCRIGPAVPVLELRNITGVAEVTPAAAAAWEAAPWAA